MEEKEIDLKELVLVIWNHLLMILLIAAACGIAGFVGTRVLVAPLYTASVSMYVTNNNRSDTSITASDLSVSQNLVDTYIVVLKSNTLLTKVTEALPYDYSTAEIGKMMTASSIDNTEAFRVGITHPDPVVAQTIANTIASVAPEEIIRVVKAGAVEVIDYAGLPTQADWPVLRNTALGAMLGLVISAAAVVLYSLLDVTIRSSEDLVKYYTQPVLGVIPAMQPAEVSSTKEGSRKPA